MAFIKLLPVQRITYIMWNWMPKWGKKALDPQRTYIRVQFLTPEEKRSKKEAFLHLQKQYGNDDEQIVPYDGSFNVSFKFTMNTSSIAGTQEPIKNKMLLNEFICHLEVTKNQQLAEFMATYVKEIQLYMHNDQMVGRQDVLPLYSEEQASYYHPEQVLEIIYEPKGLWERIKNKTKKIVKGMPTTVFSIISKLIGLILGYFGFSGGMTGIMWKMLPTSSIIQWVISAISLFFPMLGPIMTIGTKFLK